MSRKDACIDIIFLVQYIKMKKEKKYEGFRKKRIFL